MLSIRGLFILKDKKSHSFKKLKSAGFPVITELVFYPNQILGRLVMHATCRYLAVFALGFAVSGIALAEEPSKTLIEGTGPGWRELSEDDFVNVNCKEDTWKWEGGHAYCTGRPVGVIRSTKQFKNFEFVCWWMHKKHGGNSGVFVWAIPASIEKLAAGQGRLPEGIEVQVLDLGYKELYEQGGKRKADWFTCHGDVFPVGSAKMTPFPPAAPNGRRSFPTKNLTKGINQWNHYYVKAVDGEVRLWVNGEEVSGGNEISPAEGFLCLESEGSPIEFKDIRIRELP